MSANHQLSIDELIRKAASAQQADDAVKFSQSALNVAHTLRVLKDASDVTSAG